MSIDKRAIAAAFGRAAHSYLKHDELHKQSARKLLELLGKRNFITVLDAGCGPGWNSRFWRKTGSRVTALDLSLLMLIQARARKSADTYLAADIEAIPFSDAQFDLVWSHLAIQWCASLKQALNELYRVTRPGGQIAFTTLLANSLLELTQAWKAVDTQSHVNRFLSYEAVNMVLVPWRVRCCKQTVTLIFNDALSAMRSLKGIGATHLHDGRSKTLFTRRRLHQLDQAWPKHKGRYPLTYQLFHGIIERE